MKLTIALSYLFTRSSNAAVSPARTRVTSDSSLAGEECGAEERWEVARSRRRGSGEEDAPETLRRRPSSPCTSTPGRTTDALIGGFSIALYPNPMIPQTDPAREGFEKPARPETVDTFLASGIR